MLENKRGQIAVYVIISILIIAVVGLFFFFRKPVSGEEAQKIISAQVQPVRDTVDKCFYFVARKTLNTMGRQGGYAIPRIERVSIPATVMPDAPAMTFALLREGGQYHNYLPSVEEMKDEFITFMLQNPEFFECLDDFSGFRNIMDVQYGNLSVKREEMDFGERHGEIVIPFRFPVTLTKGKATTIVSDYEIKIPIDLAKIHESAATVTNLISSGQNHIVYLQDFAKTQEQELRNDPDSDMLNINSYYYEDLSLGSNDKTVYHNKILFKIGYFNKALDKPFNFYFLVGDE